MKPIMNDLQKMALLRKKVKFWKGQGKYLLLCFIALMLPLTFISVFSFRTEITITNTVGYSMSWLLLWFYIGFSLLLLNVARKCERLKNKIDELWSKQS